jgi:hypothetical protein
MAEFVGELGGLAHVDDLGRGRETLRDRSDGDFGHSAGRALDG